MKNYKGLNSRITPPKQKAVKKRKGDKGTGLFNQVGDLCTQNARQYVLYTGSLGMKQLRKAMFGIIYHEKRKAVLHKNRKKRWSQEVRDKMLEKKKQEYSLKTKELLSQDKI